MRPTGDDGTSGQTNQCCTRLRSWGRRRRFAKYSRTRTGEQLAERCGRVRDDGAQERSGGVRENAADETDFVRRRCRIARASQSGQRINVRHCVPLFRVFWWERTALDDDDCHGKIERRAVIYYSRERTCMWSSLLSLLLSSSSSSSLLSLSSTAETAQQWMYVLIRTAHGRTRAEITIWNNRLSTCTRSTSTTRPSTERVHGPQGGRCWVRPSVRRRRRRRRRRHYEFGRFSCLMRHDVYSKKLKRTTDFLIMKFRFKNVPAATNWFHNVMKIRN